MPTDELDKRARAIIARYLDGHEPLETAAQQMAALIREENSRRPPVRPAIRSPDGKLLVTAPSLSAFIKHQTLEGRANSEIPTPASAAERIDDERAAVLMEEAWRLVLEDLK